MKKTFLLLCSCIFTTPFFAQNISEYLDSYLGDNAVPYVQPLADIFTANLNTGTREWSGIDSTFYIRIKGQVIFSYPGESMKTFDAVTPDGFEPQQIIEAPTIIGKNEVVEAAGINETYYLFPTGYNVNLVPMATPQVTVGGFLHSELTGRFLAFPLDNDIGDIQFFGIGGRHDISHYFNSLPVDLSVGYMYHAINAAEYVNTNHHLISLHAGKSTNTWSAGLMLGYQTATMEANYIYTDGETSEEVSLELTNDNAFIGEISAGVKFAIVGIYASTSYANVLSASLGIGLDF